MPRLLRAFGCGHYALGPTVAAVPVGAPAYDGRPEAAFDRNQSDLGGAVKFSFDHCSGHIAMIQLIRHFRLLFAAILIAACIVGTPLSAQPSPSNPNANAVNEQTLLQQLGKVQGRIDIPDKRESVLIQPAGREWRLFHEVILNIFGAAAIFGVIVLLGVFYVIRGPIRIEGGRSGRTILRFDAIERFVHWLAGTTFVILGLTGLNFTYGKKILLPLMGPEAFSAFTEACKYAHNFLSFPFVLGVIGMLLLWAKDNLPTAVDVKWLKEGGGFIGSKHPPAWRFNAGQKLLFWGVVFATILVAVPGYTLIFPFYLTSIGGMQIAEMIHGLGAMLFIAAIIAHIYIATLGMEGGIDAMADGKVDLNWAKQHHSLWVEQELGGKAEAAKPAGAVIPAE
jgi:formate dehydrogenase subunit gamma